MSSSWNYVDVKCPGCHAESRIRIDQYNRKGKQWICRSCAFSGRKLDIKNPSAKHDPQKKGAWKSYWRAKKRVNENHRGAYKNVLFKFESFDQFWKELGERPEGMSLDRINNLGHYEPGNVRWATHKEQCRNKRSNVVVEYKGEMMCLTDAAKISGFSFNTLQRRLKAGCPLSHLFVKGRWRYKNGKLAELKLE